MKANTRAQIIVRNRKIMLGVAVLISILFAFIFFSNRAAAENSRRVNVFYSSYEIQPGDTLWSIADQFMTPEYSDKSAYISNIKKLNHMLDDNITEGNFIIVEYYQYEDL